jgi:hypothetical protein
VQRFEDMDRKNEERITQRRLIKCEDIERKSERVDNKIEE